MSDATGHLVLLSTTDSAEAARELAAAAVEARLAACVQIVGPVTSVYRWEGAVHEEQEWQLLFKTTEDRRERLERQIAERHGYDVPEIIALPVTAGSTAYLDWVTAETREAPR
ncbi:divalent-cation tolerance protein CutA [Allostreptomyces psammosilenae]|uniref:Periplasmic divalent cation tolerance protein n=1 Tax=Allostreptomyces psammosilenae TaxID=1892865 RepID=A0A853A0X5_9ACTN|nr:divalent-cation tolerance protein CutA [Allostreptomyces psammosilenae]NYI08273.1 periplasmic divalent cation tolerance protein [Allostreptomyces psammosilenae]